MKRFNFTLSLAVLCAFTAAAAAQTPFRDCADCPDMIAVPAGRFEMGTPPAEAAREGLSAGTVARETPVHEVKLARPFAMGIAEVTRDQFAAFVAATGWKAVGGCFSRTATGERGNVEAATWLNPGIEQSGNHPVICVAYADVAAYVTWLSARTNHTYRLPSEAEWEYTARAGTTTAWFWGPDRNAACKFANVPNGTAQFDCDDRFAETAPVASFQPNAFGLYDMLGNVWEWTEDCLHPSYEGAPTDGRAWMLDVDCGVRVVRGGGWAASQTVTRVAARSADPVAYRGIGLGFRVVRDM